MRRLLPGMVLSSLAFSSSAGAADTDPSGSDGMQFIGDSVSDGAALDGSSVGEVLANAPNTKKAARIVVTIQCEQYVHALTVFEDGSFKATDMQFEQVDQDELASAQAALPMLTVVDEGCPED